VSKVPLSEMIAEVEREIERRKDTYPRIAGPEGFKAEIALHIRRMEAVLATLQWLQENEDRIKAALTRKAA
jgi:hypothetical protein